MLIVGVSYPKELFLDSFKFLLSREVREDICNVLIFALSCCIVCSDKEAPRQRIFWRIFSRTRSRTLDITVQFMLLSFALSESMIK